MTFENTLYDVNTKMEKRAFDEETCKISLFEREKLEETVTLLDIAVDSKGMAVLKIAIGKITKTVSTNKTVGYFEGCSTGWYMYQELRYLWIRKIVRRIGIKGGKRNGQR